MPTDAQRDAIRYDLEVDASSMPNSEIDILYTRAEARYGAGTLATEDYVRIIAIRRLLAGAAKRTDYRQNQSEDKLSQIFQALKQLLQFYREELDLAINGERAAVRFGGLRRFNQKLFEFPDDWDFPPTTSVATNIEDVSRLDN